MPVLDEFCKLKSLQDQKKYFASHNMHQLDQTIAYLNSDLKNWLNIIEQIQYFLLSAEFCCKKREESLYTSFLPKTPEIAFNTSGQLYYFFLVKKFRNLTRGYELPRNDDLDLLYNESTLENFHNEAKYSAKRQNFYGKDLINTNLEG